MIQLDYLAGPLVHLTFHLASYSNVDLNCRIKHSKYIVTALIFGWRIFIQLNYQLLNFVFRFDIWKACWFLKIRWSHISNSRWSRFIFKAGARYFYHFFIFLPNDSSSKTMKNVFFYLKSASRSQYIQIFVIFTFHSTLSRFKRTNASGIICHELACINLRV